MKKIFNFIGECFENVLSSLSISFEHTAQDRFQDQCKALDIEEENTSVPTTEDLYDGLYTDLSSFSEDLKKVLATHGKA